jgi:hypothetical protein
VFNSKAMIPVYIKPSTPYYFPVKYILALLGKNKGISFQIRETADHAAIIWDHEHAASQPVTLWFYEALRHNVKKLSHREVFKSQQIIRDGKNRNDLIATIFYMINCVQEFACSPHELDGYGRFAYTSSYQHAFGSIGENLVQKYINDFLSEHKLAGHGRRSSFFISHDIDTLYGSWMQDGLWALKNLKPLGMLKILTMELSRRPHWKNIDKILSIHSEYDIRSTFFWMVNQGVGEAKIKNADYAIGKEQSLLQRVRDNGSVNGLHKSASAMAIDEELKKGIALMPYNRYHFLKYQATRDWNELSRSEVIFDSSMGFAETPGFRNSFGSAFQPFDWGNDQPFGFVICPLVFMDATFHSYLKTPRHMVADSIINLVEKNPENCNFGLLWHNTFFTDFKYHSFLKEYKKIVSYIYESGIKCLLPGEIVEQNRLPWE